MNQKTTKKRPAQGKSHRSPWILFVVVLVDFLLLIFLFLLICLFFVVAVVAVVAVVVVVVVKSNQTRPDLKGYSVFLEQKKLKTKSGISTLPTKETL